MHHFFHGAAESGDTLPIALAIIGSAMWIDEQWGVYHFELISYGLIGLRTNLHFGHRLATDGTIHNAMFSEGGVSPEMFSNRLVFCPGLRHGDHGGCTGFSGVWQGWDSTTKQHHDDVVEAMPFLLAMTGNGKHTVPIYLWWWLEDGLFLFELCYSLYYIPGWWFGTFFP